MKDVCTQKPSPCVSLLKYGDRVTCSDLAGRLKRNLGKGEQEQTVLEREAGEAAKKSSSGELEPSLSLHLPVDLQVP